MNDRLLHVDAWDRNFPTASLLDDLTIGVLSYKAHRTLRTSLERLRSVGGLACAKEFFIYFNAMTEQDKALAKAEGIAWHGSPANTGIYGGFRAIAETAKTPYVLILENDLMVLPGSDFVGCLESCLTDMQRFGIKVFCLKSRTTPGHGEGVSKYLQCFPVHDPLHSEFKAGPVSLGSRLSMLVKHIYLSKFKAAAIYVEKQPEIVHPTAIRKLPSGNYLTSSRYRNWGNQAVLVDRLFFLDVICRRVETHPDPRLVNGFQDIERALNDLWWRRRREPMGHAAEGVFTHGRIDR